MDGVRVEWWYRAAWLRFESVELREEPPDGGPVVDIAG